MSYGNLPPGCTDADIDRAAGGYDECYHEDYEINYEGRAHCDRCGESWWATEDEIWLQRERIEAYDGYIRREERLDKYWRPMWRLWYRLLAKLWPRKSAPIEDEVPF